MRKRLYFDKTVDLDSEKLYVDIYNGKIREYHGLDIATGFFTTINPNAKHDYADLDFKSYEMDADFELIKISRYDRKKDRIKARYKIECRDLTEKTLKDTFIRLNFIEKFIIDYFKKDTVFHRVKLYQQIVITLCIVIPTALIINYFTKDNTKPSSSDSNRLNIDTIAEPKLEKSINKSVPNHYKASDSLKLTTDSLINK